MAQYIRTCMTLLVLVLLNLSAFAEETQVPGNHEKQRDGRLLSIFQVVRFRNEPCASTNKNGTCYTPDECSSKGGVSGGSCAQGFGVCCTFSIGCGTTSSENCTYIESNNPTAGECRHTICPCNDNICQLRLDFEAFVITGPSTNSESEVSLLAGNIAVQGVTNSLASRCLTDSFSVTNTAGTNPAPICGINNGQHMYADVDRSRGGTGCNELTFQLGTMGIFATIPNRQWSIKVSMIECNAPWRAPDGCTQYFLDSADVVQTYNYDGGQHLAFQEQNICVRRARGQCRICWTTINDEDFSLTGGTVGGVLKGSVCCGYEDDGKNSDGFDCLVIPGAMKAKDAGFLEISRICGRSKGLIDKNNKDTGATTVCSRQQPFLISFISDGFEIVDTKSETKLKSKGFRLVYSQDSKNCVVMP